MASRTGNEPEKKQGGFAGAFKNLGFASRLTGNADGLTVRTQALQPQDSIPEMVSSPTDVGIYDGGHQGEKITWAKFFEDGKSRRASQDAAARKNASCSANSGPPTGAGS